MINPLGIVTLHHVFI